MDTPVRGSFLRAARSMSIDCSPLTEARGLYRMLSPGHTVEELRELIAVPPKLECVLRAYAQANPRDACWVFPALRFRAEVSLAFERMVADGVPTADVPEEKESELGIVGEACAAA